MDWLTQFNMYIQGLVLSAIIVGTLITTVSILYFFKIRLNKRHIKFVYAFSSGFLLITAIVGQFISARSNLTEHWEKLNLATLPTGADPDPTFSQTTISIAILIGGLVLGTLIAYAMKKISTHEHNHEKGMHKGHNHEILKHSPLDSVDVIMHESKVHKEKTPVIYMILTHRIPAGLLLGILLVNFNNGGEYSLAALLVFILHTIPDMTIIYYARIEAGYSRLNSFIFSIFAKLILIPFIIIGVAIANSIDINSASTYWIMPIMLVTAGIIMAWGAIFELAPSFMNLKDSKDVYKIIFTFITGIGLSLAIQFIHHH